MKFEIVSKINDIEVIAVKREIRKLDELIEKYGNGRWRKLKGVAHVQLHNGRVRLAEVHWYEAHGIGRRDMKVKHFLD